MRSARLFLALATLIALFCPSAAQESHGRYVGRLVLSPLPDGRQFELLEPFSYIDRKGLEWPVPAGAKIDGASIPSSLWTVFGAPFTGKYREASVIHDHYCDVKTRTSDATHEVFHEAMLASGEDARRAKLMYWAVLRFGPRWSVSLYLGITGSGVDRSVFATPFDQPEFESMQRLLEGTDIPIDALVEAATGSRRGRDKLSCREELDFGALVQPPPSERCRLRSH